MDGISIISTSTTDRQQRHIQMPRLLLSHTALLAAALLQLRKPRVDVRLDYENLHISLRELGWRPDAKALITTVRAAVQHLGDVVQIVAYADWDTLSISDRKIFKNWRQRAWQRDLTSIGIETRYVVNEDGIKNGADIRIVNDVRDLIEQHSATIEAADIIVLGTNDGDLRPLLESVRQRQRRVVLFAVKDRISKHLVGALDPGDIYYIDKDLQLYQDKSVH